MAQKTNKLIQVSILTAVIIIGCFLVLMNERDQKTGARAVGNTYYVKTDGSNGNSGTSWDQAWSSIEYGINNISGGDTLLVADGDYYETEAGNDGRGIGVYTKAGIDQDYPTVIKAAGNNVHMYTSDAHGFYFLSGLKNYITLEGFNIHNENGSCIWVNKGSSSYITIKNNKCLERGEVKISSGGERNSHHHIIEGNYIKDSGISIEAGNYEVQIINNVIERVSDSGGSIGISVGGPGVAITYQVENVLVHGNTLINRTNYGSHAGSIKNGKNITFSHNIWYHTYDAIAIWSRDYTEDVYIDHNTLVYSGKATFFPDTDSYDQDWYRFYNLNFTNNLYAKSAHNKFRGDDFFPLEELYSDYNYYFHPETHDSGWQVIDTHIIRHNNCPSSKCNTIEQWRAATAGHPDYPGGLGAHSEDEHDAGLDLYDLFVDPDNYDFTPKSDSWICNPDNYGSDGQPIGALPCPGSQPPSCNDDDGDGYGSPASASCDHPGLDCNDNNGNAWQNLTGYPDVDEDTYYSEDSIQVCSGNSLPAGYAVSQGNDCDDSNSNINPGTTEVCTGNKDDDCDGSVDCDDSDCQNDPDCQAPGGSGESYQGFGAVTSGGEGQTEYHVTTLANSGAGSLRSLLEGGASNRYIIFDVAGTIFLDTQLVVSGHHITINGSSAPSSGIMIQAGNNSYNDALLGIQGHDIIINNIHVRDNRTGVPSDNSADNIRVIGSGAYNLIFDHISSLDSNDGNLDLTQGVHDITVQYSLLGNNVKNQLIKYPESAGPYNLSLHHNLYITSTERQPLLFNVNLFDFVNNVVYDWANAGSTLENGSQGNFIKNYYLSTRASKDYKAVWDKTGTNYVYMEDNFIPAACTTSTNHAEYQAPDVTTTSYQQAAVEVTNQVGALPRTAHEQSLIDTFADEFPSCDNNSALSEICQCGSGMAYQGYCCSGVWQSVPCGECQEDWECTDWSDCIEGQQTRECTDLNSCGTEINKPPELQDCECEEIWQCTDWSECINNQQTRECVDIDNCGTYVNQPDLTRDCDSTPPLSVSNLTAI
ncbi:MAG: MopE-related protein [Patescibacteria group bacterium]